MWQDSHFGHSTVRERLEMLTDSKTEVDNSASKKELSAYEEPDSVPTRPIQTTTLVKYYPPPKLFIKENAITTPSAPLQAVIQYVPPLSIPSAPPGLSTPLTHVPVPPLMPSSPPCENLKT